MCSLLLNGAGTDSLMTFHAPDNMTWFAWTAIVVIAFLCLCVSAFVSGSEIAYFGLSQSDVDELEEESDDDPKAGKTFRLICNSEQLLATILIANNLVNVTMVVLLSFAINNVIDFNSDVANFLLQTVFLTFLLLFSAKSFPSSSPTAA